MLLLGRKVTTNLDRILKSRDITLPTNVYLVKAMVFPVVMYGCESWTIKKLSAKELMLLNCGVGEDSWESLGLQGDPAIQSQRKSDLNIHWKDCYWSFNTLAAWCKELSTGKDPDAGKDWRQDEQGATEDEMVGWHHLLDGHEFEQAPGVGNGQGSLAYCSPWGHKESDTTERLKCSVFIAMCTEIWAPKWSCLEKHKMLTLA